MRHAKIAPTEGDDNQIAKKSLDEVFADYDGNSNLSSDASSELSDPQQAHVKVKTVNKYDAIPGGAKKTKVKKEGKDEEQKYESKFLEMRNTLKEKVMKDVMENVLPDIGAYDVDAMADKQVAAEHWSITKNIIKVLKMLGIIKYTLHELILFGRVEDVEKLVDEIINGKDPQPGLLNQVLYTSHVHAHVLYMRSA